MREKLILYKIWIFTVYPTLQLTELAPCSFGMTLIVGIKIKGLILSLTKFSLELLFAFKLILLILVNFNLSLFIFHNLTYSIVVSTNKLGPSVYTKEQGQRGGSPLLPGVYVFPKDFPQSQISQRVQLLSHTVHQITWSICILWEI